MVFSIIILFKAELCVASNFSALFTNHRLVLKSNIMLNSMTLQIACLALKQA